MDLNEYQFVLEELKKRKIPPLIKGVVSVMLDKKAEKVVVIKLRGVSDIADFMVLCSGNSQRQNQAIADEIQRKIRKEFRTRPFSVEGKISSDWILLDYIDFVVHIFSPENRDKYALEKLWMDGKRYNFYRD
jgi:ribosome-associated protein